MGSPKGQNKVIPKLINKSKVSENYLMETSPNISKLNLEIDKSKNDAQPSISYQQESRLKIDKSLINY